MIQNMHRYALYFALIFIVFLAIGRGASRSFRRRQASASASASLVITINVVLLGGYTFGCHSFRHLVGGRMRQLSTRQPSRKKAYDCVSCLNRRHMQFAWMSLVWVALTDVYIRLCSHGRHPRLQDLLSTHARLPSSRPTSTTSWSSAPAAPGLRAAIEASAAGVSRASSASRCSARPTRSWPRAAWRRRSATSTIRDNWKVHFRTRCAAASTSTTGGWPSCTPRRRPIACASSRRGARSSTAPRTAGSSQRNFGGHRYPRLAHVGDRTGLEMIRTLQDHGVHQGIKVYMEHTIARAAQGRRARSPARSATSASAAGCACSRPRRSCWRRAASAARSRSTATAGSTPATATRWPTTRAPS